MASVIGLGGLFDTPGEKDRRFLHTVIFIERTTGMLGKFILAFIFISFSASSFAEGYAAPVVMTGITQMADTVELRFDPAPANTGTLVILGDHSKTPEQKYQFVYDVLAVPQGSIERTVNLNFNGKQKLTLSCDTLSDNCRSTDYLTEGATTFSILWKVTQR
jgi:hypothetical protein